MMGDTHKIPALYFARCGPMRFWCVGNGNFKIILLWFDNEEYMFCVGMAASQRERHRFMTKAAK
jgi:hypothetical protein